uniref:DUF5641 domain-containing protein n=1 Tax=Amphimedon queenslandica TaxID=400682 RepID=A0A1X7VB33_AMPQE
MGKIIPGKDGEVRGGIIKVLSGDKRLSLMRRPVQRFIPLETSIDEESVDPPTVHYDEESTVEDPNEEENLPDQQEANNISPTRNNCAKRAATIQARDGIIASLVRIN